MYDDIIYTCTAVVNLPERLLLLSLLKLKRVDTNMYMYVCVCPYMCAEDEEEEEVKEEEEEVEVKVKKEVVEEEVDFAPTAADLDIDEVSGLTWRCSAPHRVTFCWYLSVFVFAA